MKYFKQALLLALLCVMSLQANAQTNKVGVNTTIPTEILDVSGTMRVRDLPANNTANAIYNGRNTKDVSFNAQYTVVADGSGVLGRISSMPKKPIQWFYMPPINLPIDTADPSYSGGFFTINLYDEYHQQFSSPIQHTGASRTLKKFAANELDYYVLYYDTKVFENVTLTDAGVLKYALKSDAVVTPQTYFTIVYAIR